MSDQLIYNILKKRLAKDGSEEYLIESKASDKTTEEWRKSADILHFEDLIQEFNKSSHQKLTNGLSNGTNCLTNGMNGSVDVSHEEEIQLSEKSAQKPNGFDRGFRPFKILGAKIDDHNALMFLVMFREDMTTADLIPNHILHEKCPQLLIKFYEKNTLWKRY